MALRRPAASLYLAAAAVLAADPSVASGADRLTGLVPLDGTALADARGGFRMGDLEVRIGAVVRTAIGDAAAGADGGIARVDTYALEPGMPALPYRLEAPGTAITGAGLAALIENTHPGRTISRQVTLNVEIAGLAAAVRAAAVGRALSTGPTPRLR